MAFNGTGTFNVYTPGNPVVTGTVISSTVNNNTNSDFATGLTNCVTKDGQSTPTANLPMGGFKLTGMGTGSASTDSATIGQVQGGSFTYVATVGGTANAITLTPSPAITSYVAGQAFRFLSSGTNTTAVTVAISGLTAKDVQKNGSVALITSDLSTGGLYEIVYDGTRFQLVNPSTVGSGSVVTTTGTQTLTNKTLTAPVIATISNSGTLTLPTGAETIVGRATTDTLTNKTLTSPVINTPSIAGNSFTPIVTLVGGAGNTVPVYLANTGRYLDLGNEVFSFVYLNGDGGAEGAGTGVLNISLPVSLGAGAGAAQTIICGVALNNATRYNLVGTITGAGSASTISLQYWSAATALTSVTGAEQNNATRNITLSFWYTKVIA